MAQIKPIVFPVLGVADKLIVKVLPFETDQTNCDVYFEIQDSFGKMLVADTYTLTDSEFSEWGSDNRYLDKLVASKLPGVEIV